MAQEARHSGSLTEGSIWRQMLRFVLPIMLGTLLQQLYSMADAVIIGHYVGKEALAAIGGSDMVLINLIVNCFVGLCSGASVIISQQYGAQDADGLRRTVHTAVAFALTGGAVMTVLGVFAAPMVLGRMNTPPETMQYSVDYLRYYFLGMIPSMLYNMGGGILRAVGDSKRPLYYLIVCIFVNVGLDLLFVAVFPWAVIGAAVATTISQIVCAVLVLRALTHTRQDYRVSLRAIRFDGQMLRRMLVIGLPAGVQSLLYNVTNTMVQVAINSLGTDVVAAWSGFCKLDSIFWPINGAIGIGVMTFVGQNYGAGQEKRIYQSIRVGNIIYVVFTALFSATVVLGRYAFMGFFSDEAPVVEYGAQIACYLAPFYLTFIFTETYSAAMRGVGNAVKPALITLVTICVLRIAMLVTFVFPAPSIFNIALCYPVSWAFSSLIFLLYFKLGHWMPCDLSGEKTAG